MTTLHRNFDLAPLFRQAVGFDSLGRMVETALKLEQTAPNYPPYNIEKKANDSYRITLAVAGFTATDLSIVAQENTLVISGQQAKEDPADEQNFLHRGIAARAFERRFQIADHVKVTGARLENGLLHIDLIREVPEAAKPRSIAIETSSDPQAVPQAVSDQKH